MREISRAERPVDETQYFGQVEEGDQVPPFARPFVAIVLALIIACGIFAWELWPFTSFRLFSTVRIDHQTAWSATVVDDSGAETAYPLGGLDHGFRGFPFTMSEFATASQERQDELCRTWVDAAPELVGTTATQVRLYLREWTLSDRMDDRALPGITTLKYVCTDAGARDAG